MTKEEAWNRIDAIIARHEIDDDYITITSLLDYDALRMARKALEQEPTDTWSIKDVADTFKKHGLIVEQEPKTGHWIEVIDKWGDVVTIINGYKCSECGGFNTDKDKYCPNCGARMESEEE